MKKRFLSMLLSIAMIITVIPNFVFAADEPAFKDVSGSEYYAQSADVLAKLKILTGYSDGTFGADKPITRAEMAAVVCRMLGKEADAEQAKGKTSFDDVPENHWASGYINVATKEGIINGDGNGKFRPEDDIKFEEALKTIICVLGWGSNITINPADWSKAYLDIAADKQLDNNLKGAKGEKANRSDIAVMVYNGLKEDLKAPVASLKTGTYRGTKKITLTTDAKGAKIYYTTDGTTPTVDSTEYTKEISISKTGTLKAVAIRDGVLSSDVMSEDYTIKKAISRRGGGSSSEPEPSDPVYVVSFDLNYDGATGAPASQSIKSGENVTMPANPDREGYAFVGWYTSDSYSELFDFTMPITKTYTLIARWVDVTDTTDTDGDGLTDPIEEFYKTDKANADTDQDGLSDYVEIVVLNLNPLSIDTDNNGINDGDEDTDGDGIANNIEIRNGTDPASMDTDGDGLNDKEEETYNTNPLKTDTDDDGVSDGKEIELGTDPLVAQTTFSMNLSADNDGEGATASVQINLSGEQVETLSIEPIKDNTFFPEDMPGYMGKAYDFNVEGEFDTATINFEFNASELAPDADPVIYYFNEETQELEELETTINGNIASTEVTHFSKYILVDRKVYQESFTWQDVWDSDHNFTDIEIVFVVDDSGSMDWNDPSYERLAVARTLIDNLPANSKIGLVRFDDNCPHTEVLSELTNDRDAVKNYLTKTYFYSPGGTDMYNGIKMAFPLYKSTEDTTLKMMIVLSDGATDDTYLHSSVVETANNANIRIYTVGLGDSTSYFNNYLKPLANNTGADFYLASDATQLADIYKDISEKIDIETDSDNDGIPDYYEDNMIIFNGVKLSLDKNNPDTDGDGLLDGEEVVITKEYSEDGTKVKVTGKLVLGNPTISDTDEDGILDGDDTAPFEKGLADGIIGELSLVSCYNTENAGWTSGHVFFVYTSYINDVVDFSTLAAGWSKKDKTEKWTWENLQKDEVLLSNYTFYIGESVTIGNGAFDSGWFGIGDGSGSSGSSGGSGGESSDSGVGTENGVCYNMEVYKHLNPNIGYQYLNNTYLTEQITKDTLNKLISYCSKGSVNYWNLTHNCAEVACQAWNTISDTKVNPYNKSFLFGKVATPKGLKIYLRTILGSCENYSLANALSK